ncbi:hypothetical protein P5P86_10725 [Nocardioides sp. BP30]|uniref:hypothetical protein n=1 Tax=Nocardioides sp. BP30 TaxID=3036374 RepID=UPI0024691C12|nr:hypothetical protein [Nocardioides sp. BP30]WGL50441.1 hypothetical protein P5P86_10725 [Nocardioides sp. BP30]
MRRRLALLAPAALGLVLAAGSPALALTYGTQAHPIRAEDSSDDGNAWFYGSMYVNNGQTLHNAYHFRDSAPGGNAAYVTTSYYFYENCSYDPDDGSGWCDVGGSDRSSETTSGNWLSEADAHDLDPGADRGRMKSRVCEKQAHAFDDCSKYVIGTFSY